MNEEKIKEAIQQVKTTCELYQPDYRPAALRAILYELGYNSEEADEVVIYCAHRGFTNCIDPMIAVRTYSNDFRPEFPSQDVCYWGPDQLKSRLDSLMGFRDLAESDIRR